MALTTEIDPRQPRFYYTVGDRKSMHMALKGADAIQEQLKELDFAFNHDGILGTGWYRQAFTEDDLLDVLAALDALPQPITIQADLIRIHWEQNGGRPGDEG